VEACSEYSPLSSVGIPQAYSITSSPRATSPSASERTLPCSAVRIRAMSSRCSWTSSRIAKNNSARRARETERQVVKASFAVRTAASISSTVAKSTAPVCSPVAGFHTGPLRPEVPATLVPPIQW
jgi:hypothetical protein